MDKVGSWRESFENFMAKMYIFGQQSKVCLRCRDEVFTTMDDVLRLTGNHYTVKNVKADSTFTEGDWEAFMVQSYIKFEQLKVLAEDYENEDDDFAYNSAIGYFFDSVPSKYKKYEKFEKLVYKYQDTQ